MVEHVRTLHQPADVCEIVALYRLTVPATPERNLPARYNICPTTSWPAANADG
jgi:hypothetical protein